MASLRILVVEDDFLSRNLLSQMVSKFGAVDFAVDGLEAVEAVKASYRSKAPYSLIFLDIMMPRKDGLAALGEIREFEDSLGIPAMEVCKVIMTTALGDAKNVMSAFKSQCEAYITKPFAKKAIEEQVYKLFPELPE